ncbi:Helicase associated domain protein [Streptomyces kunmingensis]|uniref:Helicase associated domain protein n=1 Tax=Streptomyces kunmingensis TaxID=68225 RepID=A0ABU6C5G7_9ACTN|nr:Helicase associated domain protein [Streptomyces kunmingensis]MEB3959565.1 Helicase associated domain protein [Streptomyces kunmingensis]
MTVGVRNSNGGTVQGPQDGRGREATERPPGQMLRPHQVEAVDAILRALQEPADGRPPEAGLRCQCIAATGSGKTLIAAASARRLRARRVVVLVPTLDLLVQTATAWRRDGGRSGAMVGVCSLPAKDSGGLPCTTDEGELIDWVRDLEQVTLFGTYASVDVLRKAHALGLEAFDLMIIDEAHRTSGDGLKPWAAVHDQMKVPAARRLYMTATPRVWQAAQDGNGVGGGEGSRLVASMSEDSPVFGPVAYKLTLSEAIGRGLIAPYQVVCVDIRDPEYGHRAQLGSGTERVRGARLAALQAGVLTAAARENLRKLLTFHSRVAEAEAMASGIGEAAVRLWEEDPRTYPDPRRVWSSWLHGEHAPAHRRAVLEEFASDVIEHQDHQDQEHEGGGRQDEGQEGPRGGGAGVELLPAALRVLSSVKVLGEGVDTANCDSVAFCDVRGSMVDIVQMVGRALRMKPGQGKIASLVVPVFLGPDEDVDNLLTSPTYGGLAKILEALRAHDTETIEALADSRARSGSWDEDTHAAADDDDFPEDIDTAEDGEPVEAVSAGARELLKFSSPRDPAELARFLRLRVLEPEGAYWLRGIEAAARYVKERGDGPLHVPYAFVTPEDWSPAVFPLGVWLTHQRRSYKAGRLDAERVVELDGLGMVWAPREDAFADGLAAARAWAQGHGHFLPPATAVWNDYPVGKWAKNMRDAARLADRIAARREAGEPVGSAAGALTEERRRQLDDVDPGWCPAWDTGWQRCLRLLQAHLAGGGSLPTTAGDVVVQGEDLGRWVQGQRHDFEQLQPAQQWLLENALGIEPTEADERPVKLTQDHKWALNLAAARQYRAREGHLNISRKHIEALPVELAGPAALGRETTPEGDVLVDLGMWTANVRRRADKLTTERRTALDQLGMRW